MNCKIVPKILGNVDERLMTYFFFGIYEFYDIHRNIGMILQR